jgi:hypothetical protein
MENYIQLINNLGFPIFVSVWMLIKNSRDNQNMIQTLTELKLVIEKLANKEGV